jgi:LacI family transcriptional regulator
LLKLIAVDLHSKIMRLAQVASVSINRRPATLKDVARLAGVSYQTVSNIINGETRVTEDTRTRVQAAIQELGYQPHAAARSLRSGKSKIIGLLVPDANNPHFWETVSGAEQEAQRSGYSLLLATASMDPERERKAFRALSSQRLDGIIPMFTYPENFIEEIIALRQNGVPIAISASGAPMPDLDIDTVQMHYENAASELMEHLLSLGHRRIAMIWGVGRSELGNDRVTAYQECLRAAGLPCDPHLLVTCGNQMQDGYRAAERLLDLRPHPTAIIGINDLIAIGAMQAVLKRGLHIPQDISVAGFDNLPMASMMFPSLTSGHADGAEVGKQCVRMVLDRLENPERPARRVDLQTRLIIRDSTGPCPA